MITDTGKTIIAKYLIGQAPSYASHIAVGCGAKPRKQLVMPLTNMVATSAGGIVTATITTQIAHDFLIGDVVLIVGTQNTNIDGSHVITAVASNTFSFIVNNTVTNTALSSTQCFGYLDSSDKETLDFEMFRVPIISKGYVVEDNISNVVFTAELPTDDRYEISEIGIYSAAANPSAGNNDSKILYSFSTQENWEYHTSTSASAIESITKSLDDGSNILTPASSITGSTLSVFQANSDNTIFTNPDRVTRYERGRFLNSSIFIAGNDSLLNASLEPVSGNHIHLNGVSLGLDYNVSTDKLKLVFAVVNREGASPTTNYSTFNSPYRVRVLVDFVSNEKAITNVEYARFGIEKTDGVDGVNFDTNRYFVEEIALGDLVKTSGFTWNTVTTVKISTTIFASNGDSAGSGDYYLALDALRLENVSTINPLYGLTGYSPIQNDNALPVVKPKNTSNFVEFKFGFGSA